MRYSPFNQTQKDENYDTLFYVVKFTDGSNGTLGIRENKEYDSSDEYDVPYKRVVVPTYFIFGNKMMVMIHRNGTIQLV